MKQFDNLDSTNNYVDLLEQEVLLMRKWEKISLKLLDLFEFGKDWQEITRKSNGALVEDQDLRFVLRQLYTQRSKQNTFENKLEVVGPLRDSVGIPDEE